MSLNYRKILAHNVKALMDATPDLKSHAKLAKSCSTPTRKIGARTIGHLLNYEDGVQPQLDTIVAVAEAFKLPPWLLLTPDFDVPSRGGLDLPAPEVIELARRITSLTSDQRDGLVQLFGEAVTDDDLHQNGFVPTGKQAVHEDGAKYKTSPKQFKLKLHR